MPPPLPEPLSPVTPAPAPPPPSLVFTHHGHSTFRPSLRLYDQNSLKPRLSTSTPPAFTLIQERTPQVPPMPCVLCHSLRAQCQHPMVAHSHLQLGPCCRCRVCTCDPEVVRHAVWCPPRCFQQHHTRDGGRRVCDPKVVHCRPMVLAPHAMRFSTCSLFLFLCFYTCMYLQ
jgi:hypothetical protein